jgi:1-acylglycerone phosphate reductase
MSLQGTVLITGCSDGGIGSALAVAFQSRGYYVFATLRDPSKASELSKLPNVMVITLDVTNASHIAAAVQVVQGETGGSLDYLINNAGRNHFMPLLDENIETAKLIFDTNVWGTLAVTQAFATFLIKANGTLVNITSISGYLNVPWMGRPFHPVDRISSILTRITGSYAAAKRSMEIMSDTLRLELSPFKVNVLSVVTGAVQTNGLTYFDDFKLPPDSLYKSIEDTIFARAHGGGSPKRMDVAEYANKVVSTIIKGSSSKTWPGPVPGFIKFASTYFPTWLMVRRDRTYARPVQLNDWCTGQTIYQRDWGGYLVEKGLSIPALGRAHSKPFKAVVFVNVAVHVRNLFMVLGIVLWRALSATQAE